MSTLASRALILAGGIVLVLGLAAVRTEAQDPVIPCDVTCAPPPGGGGGSGCQTQVNYSCSDCFYLTPCYTGLCMVQGRGGTKITEQICNGVYSESWTVAPCGQCLG